jgi:hypothetical protein
MPQYADQSIKAPDVVETGIASRPRLEVNASSVNTYVDPGVNNLQRLGESLGIAGKAVISPLGDEYSKQKTKSELTEETRV